MKLLREYIRELLLEKEESMEEIIARDDEFYPHTFGGPHRERYSKPGTKWWTVPGGYYGGNHGDGLVTYMPNEDGTYDIKPPSSMPAKWADIAGWVFHAAYGEVKYSGIRFGQSPDGAESKGLHAGQDADPSWTGRGSKGSPADGPDRNFWSINVLHPELWNDPSAWFVKARDVIVRLEARLKELEGEHGGKALIKNLQKFAFKASSPDSEFNNTVYGPYTTSLMGNGKSEIMQSKPGRIAAEMQGLSYDVWAYLYGFLRWQRDEGRATSGAAFLEFLDGFEEYASGPGPDLSDADALERGKKIAEKLIDTFGVTKFAKIFAGVWRKLKISPREEISAFTRYSRGNRDDGYPTTQELLKKHDETTYPDGIIYEIPEEAYMALGRVYS